jgi:uncharacterized protein YjbI with pentapeptide repeats
MRISLEDGLAIGWILCGFKNGQRSACLAVKSTYRLKNDAAAVLADEPEPVTGDKHRDDDLTKSLLYPSDLAPWKPRGDVVVLATAHAPAKRPVTSLGVRIKVGPVDKTLAVFGPRVWRRELSGRVVATDPQPFVTLPITYENAFGGATSKRNPVGRGVDSDDVPQIEYPRRLVFDPRDVIDPAGFGPLAASWLPRGDRLGTSDDRWLKERWPWFPEDFDYGYFNAAPLDQQVEGYLGGDEELLFENVHAEHAVYRSRLPGRRARCFLQERDDEGRLFFRDVPMTLDTVWIDLDAERMALVWRGHAPVRTIKLKEIEQVLAWTEAVSEPPRDALYCPIFLAERQRAEEAEVELESPEAAAAAEAEDAATDAEFETAFAAFDQEMAAADNEILDAAAGAEAHWAGQKAALIASGIDPALLEPKSATESPFDAVRASIQALQASEPDQATRFQQQLADVEQLEADEAAMDKAFAADFPPELTRDDILAAIARRDSLAEKDLTEMDLAGLDLSGLDFREASLHKAILTGANLQNANLEGADLSEADLSDADLDHAVLDGADLSGATLVGCRLTQMSLRGTDFSGQKLAGMDFSESSGKGPDFSGADLTKARFQRANLPDADFSDATLEEADFRLAQIPRADLDGVKAAGIVFQRSDMTGASASGGANFTGGNFTGARAAGAVFGEALLDRTDFSRAILVRAQFSDASLREAVFDRADLTAASFDGAVLHKAVLTNANLLRAGFEQADLTEADLRGSNLYEAGFWETVLDRADFRNANVKGTTLA